MPAEQWRLDSPWFFRGLALSCMSLSVKRYRLERNANNSVFKERTREMAKITFYPIGNADSTLIEFADQRMMLKDYCNRKDPDDEKDKRISLSLELKTLLEAKDRDYFDIVAFSHSDDDHVGNAETFFWFDHAKEYQGDDKIKINELWVPACFILEKELESSARIIRQEARHRLKNNYGIRVFGNPGILDDWLKENDIEPKDRQHLITHAGECVPGFDENNGNAEIFVHSPFSFKMEDEEVDRNGACLVLHVTFFEDKNSYRLVLGSDATHESWDSIVLKTKQRERFERLIWDIFRVSHHCSYTALSPEKGKDKTEPVENVKYLFEQGQAECYLISSSNSIPSKDTDQPPHKQAAAYYSDIAEEKEGEFLVTMQEPSTENPQPIIILVEKDGPYHEKSSSTGGYTKRKSPTEVAGGQFA